MEFFGSLVVGFMIILGGIFFRLFHVASRFRGGLFVYCGVVWCGVIYLLYLYCFVVLVGCVCLGCVGFFFDLV